MACENDWEVSLTYGLFPVITGHQNGPTQTGSNDVTSAGTLVFRSTEWKRKGQDYIQRHRLKTNQIKKKQNMRQNAVNQLGHYGLVRSRYLWSSLGSLLWLIWLFPFYFRLSELLNSCVPLFTLHVIVVGRSCASFMVEFRVRDVRCILYRFKVVCNRDRSLIETGFGHWDWSDGYRFHFERRTCKVGLSNIGCTWLCPGIPTSGPKRDRCY